MIGVDEIIGQEREARDQEAGEYTETRARDSYERAVEDAAILDALQLTPTDAVLDAGCGTGQTLESLLALADRVVAVDHSARSVEIAATRVPDEQSDRVSLLTADLRDLPIGSESVDAVMSIEVLQHIPTPEARQQALLELRRVLRPGGRIALIVYRWRGHIRRHKEGYFANKIYRYAFTGRELRKAFTQAGFEDVRVHGCVIAPRVSERLGVGHPSQLWLGRRVVARPFAHYLLATAKAPAGIEPA